MSSAQIDDGEAGLHQSQPLIAIESLVVGTAVTQSRCHLAQQFGGDGLVIAVNDPGYSAHIISPKSNLEERGIEILIGGENRFFAVVPLQGRESPYFNLVDQIGLGQQLL